MMCDACDDRRSTSYERLMRRIFLRNRHMPAIVASVAARPRFQAAMAVRARGLDANSRFSNPTNHDFNVAPAAKTKGKSQPEQGGAGPWREGTCRSRVVNSDSTARTTWPSPNVACGWAGRVGSRHDDGVARGRGVKSLESSICRPCGQPRVFTRVPR